MRLHASPRGVTSACKKALPEVCLILVLALLCTGCTGLTSANVKKSNPPTPLSITTSSLPSGQVQVSYSATLQATAGTPPYAWSVFSGQLPTNLALSPSSGTISGTPTVAGLFSFVIQVSDSVGRSTSSTFSINTTQTTPLSITTSSLPSGQVQVSYSAPLQATGGAPPYAWSVLSGQLPTNLALSPSSGTISGTPTVAGLFSFVIQVSDSVGRSTSSAFSINTIQNSGNGWTLVPGTATRLVDPYWQAWPTLMKLGSGKLLLFYHEDSSGQNISAGTDMLKTSIDNGTTWTPWTGNVVATVTPTAIGSGYSSTPTCAINGNAAGSGATCTAAAPVNGAIPSITITGAGTGYNGATNYACTISGGGGSGATCKIRVDLVGGNVIKGFMLTYGSGYTSTPSCSIVGGTSGTAATCTVGAPVNVAITTYTFSGGSGYVQQPEVVIYGDNGTSPRYAEVAVTVSGGAITVLTLKNGGLGYSGTPHCVIEATTGSGGTCTATFTSGAVTAVNLTAGGSGYQQGPTITVSGGGGSGATAAATLNYCAPTDRVGCFLSDTTGDFRNVGGGITPAGTIVACIPILDENTNSSVAGDAGLFELRSTDNGNSWSAPVMISNSAGSINYSSCTGGPLISIPSGSPGVTGSCSTGCIALNTRLDGLGGADDQALIFSYDDGLTWPDRKTVHYLGAHTDETAFQWLGGMKIIGFNRSDITPNGQLYFINSSDLGSTWTINTANWPCPLPPGETGCSENDVMPVLITPNLPRPNLQTLFFGNRLSTNVTNRPYIQTLTFDQNQAISNPTGFATPTLLFNGSAGGFAPNPNFACYSAAVQISPTTVFVAFMQPYDAGTQSNLYFMTATYVQNGP